MQIRTISRGFDEGERGTDVPAKGPPRYANAAKTSTRKPNLDSHTFALAGAPPEPPTSSDPNPPVVVYPAELEPTPDSGSFVR